MKLGITMLRAVVAVSAVLALGACGSVPSDDASMTGDESLMESKANLGSCPGYDSCANFSPWYEINANAYCDVAGSCGYVWACDNECIGGGQEPAKVKEGSDPSFIPSCPCGNAYRQPKPATYGLQERYRYCYNQAGQGCTDYEHQYAVHACGC
ncbi:hypothetical protein JGU66_35175 [Myxococcaceae bacterium JPH2]|nr:hypothetical protein [Myxococcaceae bacterium JPH2]